MPIEVQQLVDDAVEDLKKGLVDNKPGNKEQAIEIIKKCLTDAFSKVSEEDHKALYKKLALKFHPDKFKQNEPHLYAVLETLEIPNALMQELGNYQEYKPDMFKKMAADPVNGTKDFISYLLEKLASMLNAYERYPEPLQTILFITHWVINGILIGALIGAGIYIAGIYFGFIWPFLQLERLFVDLVTDSRLEIEIENFKDDPEQFELAKKQVITQSKTACKLLAPEEAEQIDTMSDEEFYNHWVNSIYMTKLAKEFPTGNHSAADEERVRMETEQEITSTIKLLINEPTGFDKLAVQAKALASAIASPLPEETGHAVLQVMLVKPLQVLITPVILAASLLIETARYLHTAAIFIAIGAAVAVKLASVIIINLPLYIVDAVEYLVNACSEGCTLDCTDSVREQPEDKPDLLGSPMKGLFDSKRGPEARGTEPQEQGSYVKILSLPSSIRQVETDTRPELPQAAM